MDNMVTFDDNIFDIIDDIIDDNTNQYISTSFNKSTTCKYCLKQFGHRSGKSRHMKTVCELNPKRKQAPFLINKGYEEAPVKKAKDSLESCIIYSDNQQQPVQQPSER
jgi:hypothetical protein